MPICSIARPANGECLITRASVATQNTNIYCTRRIRLRECPVPAVTDCVPINGTRRRLSAAARKLTLKSENNSISRSVRHGNAPRT